MGDVSTLQTGQYNQMRIQLTSKCDERVVSWKRWASIDVWLRAAGICAATVTNKQHNLQTHTVDTNIGYVRSCAEIDPTVLCRAIDGDGALNRVTTSLSAMPTAHIHARSRMNGINSWNFEWNVCANSGATRWIRVHCSGISHARKWLQNASLTQTAICEYIFHCQNDNSIPARCKIWMSGAKKRARLSQWNTIRSMFDGIVGARATANGMWIECTLAHLFRLLSWGP